MSLYALLFFAAVAGVCYLVVKSYNELRKLAEEVKEGFSNISVVTRKKTALINQLITVVSNYSESEKFVHLKLSEDSVEALRQTTVSSGLVLAEIGRMAQRFPELKSNQQYNRLMDSIQHCERDVETSRLGYNERVRKYNTVRTSLPTVFYAQTVGFGAANYLTLEAQELETAGKQEKMISEDSNRLNHLLGSVGRKALEAVEEAHQQGREQIGKYVARLNSGEAAPGAHAATIPPDTRPEQ